MAYIQRYSEIHYSYPLCSRLMPNCKLVVRIFNQNMLKTKMKSAEIAENKLSWQRYLCSDVSVDHDVEIFDENFEICSIAVLCHQKLLKFLERPNAESALYEIDKKIK